MLSSSVYLIYSMGSFMADTPLLGRTILYQPKASQTFTEWLLLVAVTLFPGSMWIEWGLVVVLI